MTVSEEQVSAAWDAWCKCKGLTRARVRAALEAAERVKLTEQPKKKVPVA